MKQEHTTVQPVMLAACELDGQRGERNTTKKSRGKISRERVNMDMNQTQELNSTKAPGSGPERISDVEVFETRFDSISLNH